MLSIFVGPSRISTARTGLLIDDPEWREVWTELIETIRRAAL